VPPTSFSLPTAPTLDYQALLLVVPVLLFSVILHEYAHGYAALKQGDQTALTLGRLTLNPLKHIDPFYTIIMPIVLYLTMHMFLGGAKPVPVNPRNYRNFKRGDIIVSLAGVFANLLLAIACAILIVPLGLLARVVGEMDPSIGILQAMLIVGVYLNLMLIAFNLIPIPPLDGSHVAKYLLPVSWAYRYSRMGFLGLIVIILLLQVFPGFLLAWFSPAYHVGDVLLNAVSRFVTPGAARWKVIG